MKRIITTSILSLISLLFPLWASAQSDFFRLETAMRSEGSPGYLMFLGEGDDQEMFKTSIKGFGSGLYDALSYRQSFDIVHIGPSKAYLSLGAGWSINKYRFANNFILGMDSSGMVTTTLDTDPNHDYVNTFFGYGKTKLVYGSVYVPLMLNIESDNLILSVGGFYDFWLSGKFKRKYLDSDEKVVDKIKNSQLSNYPINKSKLGITFSIAERKRRYGIAATYMFTPFFEEGKGPMLNELRIGLFSYTNFKDLGLGGK